MGDIQSTRKKINAKYRKCLADGLRGPLLRVSLLQELYMSVAWRQLFHTSAMRISGSRGNGVIQRILLSAIAKEANEVPKRIVGPMI